MYFFMLICISQIYFLVFKLTSDKYLVRALLQKHAFSLKVCFRSQLYNWRVLLHREDVTESLQIHSPSRFHVQDLSSFDFVTELGRRK